MRTKLITFFTIFTFLISFISCEQNEDALPESGKVVPAGTYILSLIEPTDIHGYLVNTSEETVHYKLAYIADKVKDIRGRGEAYSKEKMLLLDGGDIYQGTTVSNLQRGKPLYIAFDKMDYDAVAVGNHEFDWGFENMVEADGTLPAYELDGQLYTNPVPVICANLFQNGSRITNTKDYVIVEKNAVNENGHSVTVKIGIIGFAEDWASSVMTAQFTGKGYEIKENYSIAKNIAVELEASGKCDATILLVHGAADTAVNKLGNDSVIDLVLGGHTHVNLSSEDGLMPSYLQSESYGESYAYAELSFYVDDDGNVSFANISKNETIPVDKTKDTYTFAGENAEDLDEEILKLSDVAIENVRPLLEEVIGYITVDATNNYPDTSLSIKGSDGRASVMANWMCDIIREIGNADIAFVNSGGVRTSITLDGSAKKNITVSDVYEIFPFDNRIYVYDITYEELLSVFEYAMTSSGKGLISRVTGIDCYFTKEKKLSVSGKTYTAYAVKSLSKDGVQIYADGKWADTWKDRKISVALSEYPATTDRQSYSDPHNPFVAWNETEKLVQDSLIDNENAIKVLKKEAAENAGLLTIDTRPHFILYEDISK
jgi:2',3'-cyclic-nucleotide 2'-phosphodiesterase (5'-nucleotidase family)